MLKNRTGAPVEGDDFFGRAKDLEFTWQELLNGNSLIISAPRRVGKTSLAKKLLVKAREHNWNYVELNLEQIRSEEGFIQLLIDRLNETSFFKKASIEIKEKISNLLEKLKPKVKAGEIEFELSWSKRRDKVYEDLEKALDYNQDTLIFIDELTILLAHHIRHDENEGDEKVAFFLNWLRSVRQKSGSRIRWVFCSSVGIENFVNLYNLSHTINDLTSYDLGAISADEAKDLFSQLFRSCAIPISDEVLDACLEKIDWHVPYFIQILVAGIHRLVHVEGRQADMETLDLAYAGLIEGNFFNTWDERLEEYGRHENMARKILREISAKRGGMKRNRITTLFIQQDGFDDSTELDISRVISMLQNDGYLAVVNKNNYVFRSPLIRDYWFNRFVK